MRHFSIKFPTLFVLVISVLMAAGTVLLSATSVTASETIVESFDDPLEGWKARFMGLHSNLENYYVTYAGRHEVRFRWDVATAEDLTSITTSRPGPPMELAGST